MGPRALGLLSAGVATLALLPAVAIGGEQTSEQPAVTVKAEGNVFTGGLAFDPKDVSVKVGQIVRWTNTDALVPHTATEDHMLWRLTGTYGQTPANPPGFGPGESRQRAFEAGTAHYYCEVHPTQMKGTVAVPVQLTLKHRRVRRHGRTRTVYTVVARWASAKPVSGEGFDVRVARGAGAPRQLLGATTTTSARIPARKGQKVTVEARLRKIDAASKATDWSPAASVSP